VSTESKTELSLAAIFRHCQEVQDGKREPIATKQAEELARNWLGRKKNAK
jgi:hypothetical protein